MFSTVVFKLYESTNDKVDHGSYQKTLFDSYIINYNIILVILINTVNIIILVIII